MVQDCTNPAFPRAIPPAMLVFCSLLKVVFFTSFLGSRNRPKMGTQMDRKRDFWGPLGRLGRSFGGFWGSLGSPWALLGVAWGVLEGPLGDRPF